MPFIKKDFIQFIHKEKYGAAIKSKLVEKKLNQKIKKHNQLYLGTLVLAWNCYCEERIKYGLLSRTLASKNATSRQLTQSQSNDKLLWKVMSSSYHIE